MTVYVRPDWCVVCEERPVWMKEFQICATCYQFMKAFGKFKEFQANVIAARMPYDSPEFDQELTEWLNT